MDVKLLAFAIAMTAAGATGATGATGPQPPPNAAGPNASTVALSTTVTGAIDLPRLAAEDIEAARPELRRLARSASVAAERITALRLLGTHDANVPTMRICARALRLDVDPLVRRAGAECIGKLGASIAAPATPALVAALADPVLDVVTMAGWALAHVGDATCIARMDEISVHPDPRVARLFTGYVARLLARFELTPRPSALVPPAPARDAQGRRLIAPGAALVGAWDGLDKAASVTWLGLYGGSMGWLHGGFVAVTHGGPDGAHAAGLFALTGAGVGAAVAGAYALARAPTMASAHTVVQLGTFGTLAGVGAGMLTGFPPGATVAAANLALAGTLAGTAAGVALVETRPPSLDALGVGLVSAFSAGLATGALWGGYGLSPRFSNGAGLLGGAVVGIAGTLAVGPSKTGLFPVAGGFAGTLLGAGAGAAAFLGPSSSLGATAAGWAVAATTVTGTALGALGGMALPRSLDPLLDATVQLAPPTVGAVAGPAGTATSVLALSATF